MPRFINDLDVFYDPSLQKAFSPAFDEGTVPAIPPTNPSIVLSTTTSLIPFPAPKSTISYYDASKGVTLNGTYVAGWADQLGTNDLIGNVGHQPTTSTTITATQPGGITGIKFSASTNLQCNCKLPGGSASTLFMWGVYLERSQNAVDVLASFNNADSPTGPGPNISLWSCYSSAPGGPAPLVETGGNNNFGVGNTATLNTIHSLYGYVNSSTSEMSIDTAPNTYGAGYSGYTSSEFQNNVLSLGAANSYQSYQYYLPGSIFFFCLCNAVPSLSELIAMQNWMNVYFGATPGASPYQSVSTFGIPTGSISQNTTAIDAYTQGVELTQLKRHDAGFAKIWSGEPGHEMLQTWYGERSPCISKPFSDDETAYFSEPETIIKNNPSFPLILFPIQPASEWATDGQSLRYNTKEVRTSSAGNVCYRSTQDVQHITMNGVIEPLTVRLQPSFYNIDVPVNANHVLGACGNGNLDKRLASDFAVTIYYWNPTRGNNDFDEGSIRYVDVTTTNPVYIINNGLLDIENVEGLFLINNETTTTTTVVAVGTLGQDVSESILYGSGANVSGSLGVFNDARLVRNTIDALSEPRDMLAAMSLMTGSTANYIRYDQRSANCGLVYDNNVAIGTDSMVFGGMTY